MLPGLTRTEIAGKPADIFEPATPLPFTVIWLHDDSGESPATSPVITTALRKHRLRCVAPHAGRSWWVDRVSSEFDPITTPERFLLDDVLPWCGSRWNVGPSGIAVAGIGMGGQGALRLAFRHPGRFPIAGSIAGTLDYHERHGHGTPLDELYPSRENARQDTAILHIHGHDWPPHIWFACSPDATAHRGNDRLHEKLAAIGVPHTSDLDTRAEPEQFLDPLFTFLGAALERESRRLM